MLTTSQLQTLIESRLPGAEVRVRDLTGTSDHFRIEVRWSGFAGKSLIDQHRLVQSACREHLGGAIHAIEIKTQTA
jgi:stress-induced morphogen